jgi:thiol-disulfide isomerase/thioredoxin
MTDLDGRVWDTKQLGHKATLIDFWATWCAPCRRDIPNLIELYGRYKGQGFEIVGVSVDDGAKTDEAALRTWAQQQGMTWPLVYDKQYWNSPIVKACGVSGIPFPILVDEQGRVVAAGQDATGSGLRTALKKIFG